MTDNELLLEISNIVSKNVKLLDGRIDRLEEKMDRRFEELETRLTNRIDAVDGRVDHILVRLENNIEPRLSTIESCYTSTYERYQYGVDKIEPFCVLRHML